MDNSEKKNVELNIYNGELKTSMIPEDLLTLRFSMTS